MAPNGNGGAETVLDVMAAPAVGRPARNSRLENSTEALNMKLEANRVTTFEKWPVSFINKLSMASAGFYYLNKNDIVRCAFCGVEVGRWEEGDNPLEEHKRWAPACPFVRKKRVVEALTKSNINSPADTLNPEYDVCGLYGVEIRPNSGPEKGNHSQQNLLEQLSINKTCGPVHRACVSMNARMKSFDSWPKFLKPRPEELSEAGFFYTGKGDETLCFNCGCGLKNWQPTDDPWIEHGKWSPRCTYVILNKGKEFIQKALAERQPMPPSDDFQNMTIEEKKQKETPNNSCSSTLADPTEPPREQSSDSTLCKICYKEELGVVFLPCGHVVACVKCASAVTNCPVCCKPLSATVRAFLS